MLRVVLRVCENEGVAVRNEHAVDPLRDGREGGFEMSETTKPTVRLDPVRMLRAATSGRYSSASIASTTRRRAASLTNG